MIRSFRFSTGDLSMRARGNAVRELRERGILPLEPLPDRAVHVRITKWFLPGAAILSGALCGLRQEASPQAMDASDDLFFGVNLAGSSSAVQGGRDITLEDGDAILLSYAAGSFTIIRPTPVQFIGLRVPRKTVAPLIRGLDGPAMRFIPGQTEALKLLTKYVGMAINALMLSSPDMCRLVVTHLHDLIALSAGATRDAAVAADGRSLRAVRLQAIKSDIAANLGDESLTLSALAARHGVTPRYVHKLFESEGITYTQFTLRQRLDRAYRMLRDPRFATRSVSSIAYDVGFGDLSYFNRAFRRHYQATPSDIRSCAVARPTRPEIRTARRPGGV